MKKRLLAVFLAIAMMLSMASFGVAAETTNQADVEVVYLESKADLDSIDMMPGVVYIWPNDDLAEEKFSSEIEASNVNQELQITPFGTEYPTAKWNISTKGQYDLSGKTTTTTTSWLYSEYLFHGVNEYWVEVTNKTAKKIEVELITKGLISDTTHASFSVPANSTAGTTPSISSDKAWFISFCGNAMEFVGFVKKWS